MPNPRTIGAALEAAEQAAGSGDPATAERCLREAAALQEVELGHLHPDLANTLNNLGVVCEQTGKLDDAEQCYRRAYGIAKRALVPDHPFIATAEDNLRQFCEARGIPFLPTDSAPGLPAPGAARMAPAAAAAAAPALAAVPARGPAVLTSDAHGRAAAPSSHSVTAGPNRPAVVGVVGLVLLTLLLAWMFGGRSSEAPLATTNPPDVRGEARTTTSRAPAPANAEAARPDRAAPSLPRPAEPARSPVVDGRAATSTTSTTPPTAATPAVTTAAAGATTVTVLRASLCRTLETNGTPDWRCDAAGADVPAGSLSFYTRVAAPRDTTVEHRWYRDDALRQRVELRIRANAESGFRTYSRTTVSPGAWRVELRGSNGDLLQQERVVVR
jgi:hypothetical protein